MQNCFRSCGAGCVPLMGGQLLLVSERCPTVCHGRLRERRVGNEHAAGIKDHSALNARTLSGSEQHHHVVDGAVRVPQPVSEQNLIHLPACKPENEGEGQNHRFRNCDGAISARGQGPRIPEQHVIIRKRTAAMLGLQGLADRVLNNPDSGITDLRGGTGVTRLPTAIYEPALQNGFDPPQFQIWNDAAVAASQMW